jgi:hypothetical protein
MKSLSIVLGVIAFASTLGISVFSSMPRIVSGTGATSDVTFSPAFSTAPVCTCTYIAGGFDPATDTLICAATTTTLDIDVDGGGDPSVGVGYICVGN